MKLYTIFRNEEGELTFKLSTELVYTVYARSRQNAQEMLERLANNEKNTEEDAI